MNLAHILRDNLQRKTKRSSPLPIILQIMVALRFFAYGSFQAVLNNTVGIGQSSISQIVFNVSRDLSRMVKNFIKFIVAEQILIKHKLFEIILFANVLGAVDGTHIAIKVNNM